QAPLGRLRQRREARRERRRRHAARAEQRAPALLGVALAFGRAQQRQRGVGVVQLGEQLDRRALLRRIAVGERLEQRLDRALAERGQLGLRRVGRRAALARGLDQR